MMKRTSTHLTQKGFTLLELLLSVGLLAMLLAGIYQIFDNWSQRAVNRVAAADMLRVQNAAQEYATANFETLRSSPVGVFYEINMNDLRADNYLPTGYQPRNAFKQTIRVFRRNLLTYRLNADGSNALDANGNLIPLTTIEIVTVSDNPAGGTLRIDNKRLLDTASAGGPKMGVVTDMVLPGANYSGLVTSTYNEWFVNRSDLQIAGYGATPNARGGYLASYGRVNNETSEINDRLLYRVAISTRPELNRMQTNLRMNGNRVESVGTVVADKYSVTGNAAFRGTTQDTTSETAQAMTVEQALRVDGAGQSRINMRDTTGSCSFSTGPGNRTLSGGGCNIVGGEMSVIAENRVDPVSGGILAPAGQAVMNISNLRSDGNIITDLARVQGTTDAAGTSTFTSATGTNLLATHSVAAPTINVTGGLVGTSQMQTAAMSVSANSSAGQLVAARVTPNNNGFATDNLYVGNTVTITDTLQAYGAHATHSLYMNRTLGSYYDAVTGRTYYCTPFGANTYCEPSGTSYWQSGSVREDCGITGSGFYCHYYRYGVYFGSCSYVRSSDSSGHAAHAASCS